MMDQIHHTLYNNACPFNSLDLKHTFCKDNKCIILPAALSRRHLILTCLEKGLFLYPLKKFVKSARLLFSGNTYRDYIPTEYKFFKEDIEKITNNRECCCERCT
jgi:hypothetical protein